MSQNDSDADAEIDSLEAEYEHPPRPIPSDNDTTYRQGTPFAEASMSVGPNGTTNTTRKHGVGTNGKERTTLGNASVKDLVDRLSK